MSAIDEPNKGLSMASLQSNDEPGKQISVPAITVTVPTGETLSSTNALGVTASEDLSPQPVLDRSSSSWIKHASTFVAPPPGVLHLLDGKAPAEIGGFDCRDARRPRNLDAEVEWSVEDAYDKFVKSQRLALAETGQLHDVPEQLDSYKVIVSRFSEHRASVWKQAKINLMREMPQTRVQREFNRMIWHQTVNAVESGTYYDTYGEEVDLRHKIGDLLPSVLYTGDDLRPNAASDNAEGSGLTVLVKSRIGVDIFDGSMLVLLRKTPEFKKYRPLLLNMTAEGHAGGACRDGDDGQEEHLFMSSNYFQTYAEGGNRWDADTAVYTPRVTFFRGIDETSNKDGAWVESGYPFLQYGQVRTASCIALAGIRQPTLDNAFQLTLADQDIYRKKIRLVLRVAVHQGHHFLILGAIGCGELANPPKNIAGIFRDVIMEPEFQDENCCIKRIWFAMGANIPDDIVDPFKKVFETPHFSHTGAPAAISQALALVQGSSPNVPEQISSGPGAQLALRRGPEKLNIIFHDRMGPEVTLKAHRYEPLRMTLHVAFSIMMIDEDSHHFSFHGKPVYPTDTAEGLHIGEGSVVFLEYCRIPTAATNGRPQTVEEPPILDLERRCTACYNVELTSLVEIQKNPEMLCSRCGVRSFPQVWKRPAPDTKDKPNMLAVTTDFFKKGVSNKVTTSGEVLEQDYEGQHVEAPVGGMLALVTQVQRERLCLGAICYFFFCLTFVIVATMQRPVQQIFEVQSALHRELISEVVPGTTGRTFLDIANWGEFWMWADGVLMKKVYGDNYALNLNGNTTITNSMFTVAKYNRVLSAVRFRQVRVKPSLPECSRDEKGFSPTVFDMACARDGPADSTYSCDTPLQSHSLSRPCWGKWSTEFQEQSYPGAFELARAKQVLQHPSWSIMCLDSCEAYFVKGYRTQDHHAAFGLTGVLHWVGGFDIHASAEQGRSDCRAACSTSATTWETGLSVLRGKRLFPDFSSSADVVLLPLVKLEAEKRFIAMRREHWTSEATRGLAVEINTYNPNYDLATAVRIMVDSNPGGSLEPHIEMVSCPLAMFGDAWDSLRFVLEIVFCVWLLYYFLVEALELYKLRWNYFFDLWNYIELANLTAYVVTMVMWFNTVSSSDFSNFKKRDVHNFKDLYPVALEFNFGASVASFNLIYGFVRFFKYFRLSMKFRMFWDTLASALQIVLPLLLAFLACTCVFLFSGHWLFGHRVQRFSSISEALLYLLVSIKDGINYDEIKTAAPAGAPVWYFAWYFFSKILVLGLCIAITTVFFGEVLRQSQAQEASRQTAVTRGAKIPTLMNTVLRDFAPCLIDNTSKEDIEAHENHRELKEALQEVDLENLWSRVMQGVLDQEVALDAGELKFLFGSGPSSEQSARHFINRVCNLACLERVDVQEGRTVVDEIQELEKHAVFMEAHIHHSRDALSKRFPKLRTFLARSPQVQSSVAMEAGRQVRYVLKEGMDIGGVYHLVEMRTDEVDLDICAYDGARGKTMHMTVPDAEANGDYVGLARRLRLGTEFGAGGEQRRLSLGPALDLGGSLVASGGLVEPTITEVVPIGLAVSPKSSVVASKRNPTGNQPRLKGQLSVASAVLDAKRKGMAAINFQENGDRPAVSRFVQTKPVKRSD